MTTIPHFALGAAAGLCLWVIVHSVLLANTFV